MTKTPADEPGLSSAPRDALDHDGDGHKGGLAPIPATQHLVVVKDDARRQLNAGAVIAVSDDDARALLKSSHARVATPTDVELAQPFVRPWTA